MQSYLWLSYHAAGLTGCTACKTTTFGQWAFLHLYTRQASRIELNSPSLSLSALGGRHKRAYVCAFICLAAGEVRFKTKSWYGGQPVPLRICEVLHERCDPFITRLLKAHRSHSHTWAFLFSLLTAVLHAGCSVPSSNLNVHRYVCTCLNSPDRKSPVAVFTRRELARPSALAAHRPGSCPAWPDHLLIVDVPRHRTMSGTV
jgi:hypothetical protein